MAEDVRSLLLRIEAQTELMRRELLKGERALSSIEAKTSKTSSGMEAAFRRINKSAASMAQSIKTVGAAVAAAFVANAARGAIQFADDIQTAADRAGISASSYQRIREALRELELSAKDTDRALEKLVTIIGEVQSGNISTAQADALQRLGVYADIASGKIATTADLLDAIGKAAARYETQAQFAADVTAILGDRIGVKLAAALADGGQAFQELAESAKVASDAQVEALARANNALERLAERARRTAVIIGGSFMIAAEQIAEAFAAATSPRNFLDRFSDLRRESALAERFPVAPFLARETPVPTSSPRVVERSFPDTSRRAVARSASPPAIPEAEVARLESFAQVAAKLTESARAAQQVKTYLEDLEPIIKKLPDLSAPYRRAADFARQISDNLGQAIVYGRGIGAALVASFKAAAAEAISSRLFELLVGFGPDRPGLFGRALASIFGGFRATGGPVSPGRAYVVGERGPELFVPRAAGTILPSVKAAPPGAATGPDDPGIFGKALASIFGGFRAAGGPVAAGRAYVVGERGPELFVPRAAGAIMPSAKAAMPGAATIINIDARGSGDPAAIAQAAVAAIRASTKYTDARLGSLSRSGAPRSMGAI